MESLTGIKEQGRYVTGDRERVARWGLSPPEYVFPGCLFVRSSYSTYDSKCRPQATKIILTSKKISLTFNHLASYAM